MGRGAYLGSHTKIFITKAGTRWEVSDRAQTEPDPSVRKRWDVEIAVETGRKLRKVSKQARSFLSMCAVAFHNDLLTDNHPEAPLALQKAVIGAGGNKKWIVRDSARLRVFEELYRKIKPVRQRHSQSGP